MKQQIAHAFLLIGESHEDQDCDDGMSLDPDNNDAEEEDEELGCEEASQDGVDYNLQEEISATNASSVAQNKDDDEELQDLTRELNSLLGQQLEEVKSVAKPSFLDKIIFKAQSWRLLLFIL